MDSDERHGVAVALVADEIGRSELMALWHSDRHIVEVSFPATNNRTIQDVRAIAKRDCRRARRVIAEVASSLAGAVLSRYQYRAGRQRARDEHCGNECTSLPPRCSSKWIPGHRVWSSDHSEIGLKPVRS